MSAIEKLDSVLAKWHENAEDNAAYGELLQAGKAIAYEDCADDLDALMPAIRQAMIDARRYRWLREHSHLQDGLEFWIDPVIAIDYKPGAQLNGMHETLDAAIDARLASDSEGEP